jgi:E3 ubiquitin-protein ligase RBBP6
LHSVPAVTTPVSEPPPIQEDTDEAKKIQELIAGAGNFVSRQVFPLSSNHYLPFSSSVRGPSRWGTGISKDPNRIPPPNYVCHRCNTPGHFINHCPTNGDSRYDFHKVKKPTGIPRTMLQPVSAGDAKGTLMMPGGGFARMKPNEYVFILTFHLCNPHLVSVSLIFVELPLKKLHLV